VPEHLDTVQTWFPIACQGATELMMNGNGVGSNWLGFYPVSLADAQHMWRLRQHELSEMVKFVVLLGGYMKKYYRGQPYAKAQNVRRRLTQNYDRVFESVDLLLFPTTPFTAPAIPDPGCSRAAYLEASGGMVNNTVAANLTHHPAMNVPCGMLDGLPVGLTLVARHWHESVIYRAAHAFEQHDDWRSL
jgi:amidase